MKRKSFAGMGCPIARSLDVIGEWWTLLIIRDAFVGATRFDEFRKTGIADNILSSRLDLLVREGVFERRLYQDRPPRYEYLLTEKGRDLLPVISALAQWGLRWTETTRPLPRLLHTQCATEMGPDFYCPNCGVLAGPGEIRVVKAGAAESDDSVAPVEDRRSAKPVAPAVTG